jgi:hypothetical protein
VKDLAYSGDERDLYYHGTGAHLRARIQAEGLVAHQPGAGVFTEAELAEEIEHPSGVYITKSFDHASEYGEDVWLVDCTGLTYQYAGQDESVAEDIAPERLRLVTIEPQLSDMQMLHEPSDVQADGYEGLSL